MPYVAGGEIMEMKTKILLIMGVALIAIGIVLIGIDYVVATGNGCGNGQGGFACRT